MFGNKRCGAAPKPHLADQRVIIRKRRVIIAIWRFENAFAKAFLIVLLP
jgi:hypothetical protein